MSGNARTSDARGAAGFAVVDEKGRVALPKAARTALGVYPGSTVACVLTEGALLLIPQDAHLEALMHQAARAVAEAGLTAHDYLEALPAIRGALMREHYGDDFVNELERRFAAQPRTVTATDEVATTGSTRRE